METYWSLITLSASIGKSFYSIKYGLSIIMSNVCQRISVMKTLTLVFLRNDISKIVHFGILIHVLCWNIYFRLLRKNTNWKSTIIWRNNWRYIICQSRRTRLMYLTLHGINHIHSSTFFSILSFPYVSSGYLHFKGIFYKSCLKILFQK